MTSNTITWFEIPAGDFDRAVEFYSALLQTTIRKGEFGGLPHGFFRSDEDAVTGAIVYGNGEPLAGGALIFLNAQDRENLVKVLDRAPTLGGKVAMPLTAIPPQGFIAVIIDSEGNRVGLHASES